MKLVTTESAKIVKSLAIKVLTFVLYLSPHDESVPYGGKRVCPNASTACILACLGHTSGRMVYDSAKAARVRRTLLMFNEPDAFEAALVWDLAALRRAADRKQLDAAFRFNGDSDMPIEQTHPYVLEQCSLLGIRPYDYTKVGERVLSFLADRNGRRPPKGCKAWSGAARRAGYHLTFSLDERPESERMARRVLRAGGQVAVVFRSKPFPASYLGAPVVDGDVHDVLFRHPDNCVIGLKAKGRPARQDTSGFVKDAFEVRS